MSRARFASSRRGVTVPEARGDEEEDESDVRAASDERRAMSGDEVLAVAMDSMLFALAHPIMVTSKPHSTPSFLSLSLQRGWQLAGTPQEHIQEFYPGSVHNAH